MSEPFVHIYNTDSEADTCRREVLPRLYASQWTDDMILEQRNFTDGKIIIVGRKAKRKKARRFDYLLRYSLNFPIAIVEAKVKYKEAGEGIQQAKEYAQILGLKFAYSTNGTEIIEFDSITGIEKFISQFPTPNELWNRLKDDEPIKKEIEQIFLKPFFTVPGKEMRYYQRNAVNKAVKAILEGRKRTLLTLATGTGKTTIAFQIIYKLWNNRWNIRGDQRRPKVLYLADRSVLVTDPHAKDFAVFGDARCLVPDEGLPSSRDIYFSTYQSLAEDDNRVGAFRQLSRNFFDLIVVDECHRGSATDDSNWRIILNYFNDAVKLGLTATPLRDDNIDTYHYFGNPLYTYSLKQGIEDGFLAPYIVHRIVPEPDALGFRPQEGQLDANGELIPDGIYTTPDFETILSHLPRTKAVAKHLFDFMVKYGRFDKTIVFCVNQEHADHFRREISNLNSDMVSQYPDYVVRIVADEKEIGKGHLGKFMDIDEPIPVVVTTSRLLSTGVDVQTCKNIVLFREVNSMTEFKQIIGRGTRVREDKEKLFFTILDYTGSATRKFADPVFDGDPPLITEEEIDENGDLKPGTDITISDPAHPEEDVSISDPPHPPGEKRKKYYIREGEVRIVAESVQITGADGKLRTIHFTQYAREQIATLFPSVEELRSKWSNVEQRNFIFEQLEDCGISVEQLMDITHLSEADPFDLLCFVAYDLKPKTRKQRADLIRRNKTDFFAEYSVKAQHILQLILEKYVEFGLNQIRPDIISSVPINAEGNEIEIVNAFGGIEIFRKAIEQLQVLLYEEAA